MAALEATDEAELRDVTSRWKLKFINRGHKLECLDIFGKRVISVPED